MKKEKIGLVLGGGGAKGAFQAGVLKALEEEGFIDIVTHVSSNSIGSINALMVMDNKISESFELWKNIKAKDALTMHKFSDLIKRKTGLFTRTGVIKILKNNVDFKNVARSSRQLYITAFNEKTEKIEYFPAHHKSEDEIMSYVLASSAIPYVYAPVNINGTLYHDGYVDNVPITPLKDAGCKIIIVSGLNPTYHPTEEEKKGVSIIDFTPPFNLGTSKYSALDFKENNINFRIENGYQMAKEILSIIKRDKNNPLFERHPFKRFLGKIFRYNFYRKNDKIDYYYRLKYYKPAGKLNDDNLEKTLSVLENNIDN